MGELKVADMPLEKFAAHVEVGDHALAVNHVTAKVGGGSTQGEWKMDWSGSPAGLHRNGIDGGRYSGSRGAARYGDRTVGAVDLRQRPRSVISAHFEGKNAAGNAFQRCAAGSEFQVSNGNFTNAYLDSGRPLKFNGAQGAVEIDKQVFKSSAKQI